MATVCTCEAAVSLSHNFGTWNDVKRQTLKTKHAAFLKDRIQHKTNSF
jgi:hypothetical protein